MRHFRLSLLIIVACLLFATPLALAGCGGGISDEQRENYLQMAKEYEAKASEQQRIADECWKTYAGFSMPAYSETQKNVGELCKRYDKLAEDYRQQALHYRTLAAQ